MNARRGLRGGRRVTMVRALRTGGRAVEGARLESAYTSKAYRGFESLPVRQISLKISVLRAPSRWVHNRVHKMRSAGSPLTLRTRLRMRAGWGCRGAISARERRGRGRSPHTAPRFRGCRPVDLPQILPASIHGCRPGTDLHEYQPRCGGDANDGRESWRDPGGDQYFGEYPRERACVSTCGRLGAGSVRECGMDRVVPR